MEETEIVLESLENEIPDFSTPEEFIGLLEELLLNGLINNEQASIILRDFVGAY